VYLDGCFDVMHYGHANALRQARMLGDQLVVGLISDDEIRQAKGPPVMNYQERKTLVSSVKWVDEVIDGAQQWRPYTVHLCALCCAKSCASSRTVQIRIMCISLHSAYLRRVHPCALFRS
jgi:cytidyltransferase-like protein